MIKTRGDLLELVGKLTVSDSATEEQIVSLMSAINLLDDMIDKELPGIGLTE
jgi:hypothetical protein